MMKRNQPPDNTLHKFEEDGHKKKRLNKMSENSDYCEVCEQNLDEVLKYKGHPDESENEIITLTYGSLIVTHDENSDEKPMYKLTDFSVYDKHGHLCPFDTGLIEAGKKLMASGYVKQICNEDPSRDNGVPTNCIGPLDEWCITGFDGGKNALLVLASENADYFLLEPSLEYQPIMKSVETKKHLIKLIIDFLLDKVWNSPSYEELLQWFEIHSDLEVTEEILLMHAQFVCDQVMSYDAAGDSNDDIFITTPCMRTLAEKANVILKQRQYVRKFETKNGPLWSKAATTNLVRDVFETYFKDQIDENRNYESPRNRFGVGELCQKPDCGRRSECPNMQKFDRAGCSKQFYQRRRCTSLSTPAMKKNEDSDSEPQSNYTKLNTRVISCSKQIVHKVRWISKQIATFDKCIYYDKAQVGKMTVKPLDYVMVNSSKANQPLLIAKVAYMWQERGEQMFHACLFYRGYETILGETSNPREIFMVDHCENCSLGSIVDKAKVVQKKFPTNWALQGGIDGLQPLLEDNGKEFFYSKFYNLSFSRFEDIVEEEVSANTPQYASCSGCSKRYDKEELETPKFKNGSIHWLGSTYSIGTAVFLKPNTFTEKRNPSIDQFIKNETTNNTVFSEYYRKTADEQKGSHVNTPDPFDIGIIENIIIENVTKIVVRKFYRPEQTVNRDFLSYEKDLNLLYYSYETCTVSFKEVQGVCYVAYGDGLGINPREWTAKGPYRFYFTQAYHRILKYSEVPKEAKEIGIKLRKKGKGKAFDKRGAASQKVRVAYEFPPEWEKTQKPLACMDVFAGCGGLSEGLRQSGVADIKWAIDNDSAATHAFKLNNPSTSVYTADCNELLFKVMANKEFHGRKLPQKGEVEMIVGGPPCQGFSGMNRFNGGQDSSFKNALIVSFLSYCDYYRPRYILMENVRNFSAYHQSVVFKLTLRCLLAIGYQVTFGVLQAGNYGVPQSRRRLIIMAAAPGYVLPLFPEPQNTFNKMASQLGVAVGNTKYYIGAKWLASAPYRTLTVRDAIGDLPDIESGCNREEMPFDYKAVSHFQRMMRASGSTSIAEHISKEMAPLVQSRISHIPLSPGSDWRNLPNIVVKLSDGTSTTTLEYFYRSEKQKRGPHRGVCICCTGEECDPADRQVNTLIPWCLAHTADRHNNWAGLYGRLDWDGFFSTTVTNPEPMGKQGRVLHPDQNRVISVRECARSQGFPDHYQFYGSILNKHRQVGNAVPPPLAVALGREIQKCLVLAENVQP